MYTDLAIRKFLSGERACHACPRKDISRQIAECCSIPNSNQSNDTKYCISCVPNFPPLQFSPILVVTLQRQTSHHAPNISLPNARTSRMRRALSSMHTRMREREGPVLARPSARPSVRPPQDGSRDGRAARVAKRHFQSLSPPRHPVPRPGAAPPAPSPASLRCMRLDDEIARELERPRSLASWLG